MIDSVTSKLASVGTFFRLPFSGGSFVKPLTTELLDEPARRAGWFKFRASGSSSVHCRLGGDFGGGGTGAPSEDNPATLAMFLGKSAPQKPTGQFDPGCVAATRAVASDVTAMGVAPSSSSAWSPASLRASSHRAARRSVASRRSRSAWSER